MCEKCIVSDHGRCIVKSYLAWLQDSDYDPCCSLCSTSLENGQMIRLVCLDLFHKECLDKACNLLPNNTAPGGYTCPTCLAQILPSDVNAGHVAQALRISLSDSIWAKDLLLPYTPETRIQLPVPTVSQSAPIPSRMVVEPTVRKRDEDDDKYKKSREGTTNFASGILPPNFGPKKVASYIGIVAIVLLIVWITQAES